AHDYLWRIHQQVPAAGEIVIFNRSHFEDVLVPVVRGWITDAEKEQRYAQLNDFERMLTETGTVILKFFLHVSKEEQRQRLQARLDDPTKHWKFAIADLDERKRWDDYQAAYGEMIAATGTSWAPWTVVPADSKTHRNLMIATAVVDAMRALKLRYPPGDPALAGIQVP
ncbi:MAG TPA: polyphosphate--nucleotide phosphotransferase, partial [Caldimonas sp.]|nr:polyphosphate--nucleotide phosphotransferase [Caldimonas sp.]